MKRLVAFALPSMLAALPVSAQTAAAPGAPPAPSAPSTTLNANSTLVLVPALVRDKSGDLVLSLQADDFALADDGLPQKLHIEKDTDSEPLALVVLIEAGAANRASGWKPHDTGAPSDRFSGLPAMVWAMAGGVPHRIAVVGFDSGPELLQNFTSSTDAVDETIHYMNTSIDGDGGAAILDALSFSLDLLRHQPPQYRRAILLLSETNDRGSKTKLDDALRAVSDTNTTIYSLGFSTGNTRASEYANRELPTKTIPCPTEPQLAPSRDKLAPPDPPCTPAGQSLLLDILSGFLGLQNPNPGPAHGCMSASDPNAPVAKNPAVRLYDCIGQLAPPLAIAKVGAIAATEDIQRNVPETVARLTGGEYYKFSDARSLEASLQTITNHIPNRYILSFQPDSPHAGFHLLTLGLPNYTDLHVSARNGYWADSTTSPAR